MMSCAMRLVAYGRIARTLAATSISWSRSCAPARCAPKLPAAAAADEDESDEPALTETGSDWAMRASSMSVSTSHAKLVTLA